ncbi:MAG: hypothetical protein JW753_02475 [Dehalococcoidia bacterium]|nr:hypothetical protein [Dehalococcoidia bacterium]
MICKDCRSRVPDKDDYCVTCGQRLRPGWVNWVALALIVGTLLAISPVAYSLLFNPVGDIASQLERTVFLINGWCWLILASAQTVAATYLLVMRRTLLRNIVLAVVAVCLLFAISLIPFLGAVGLGASAVLVVVLIILFRRR